MESTEYALIVAGGKGTRIPGEVPKQFLVLGDRPMLMHTIQAFRKYSAHIHIVLVLPPDDFSTWKTLCSKFDFNVPLTLQAGGKTRFQSVKNGLNCIAGDGLVAIHDGARPLVTSKIIKTSFDIARASFSAVGSVKLKESLRHVTDANTFAVNRDNYRIIQTPQTFHLNLIRKAYELPEDPSLTDDASVAERAGNKITLFEGSYGTSKSNNEYLSVAESAAKKSLIALYY